MFHTTKQLVTITYLQVLILFPVFSYAAPSGTDPDVRNLESYAQNKAMPAELRQVILTALSYYPELKETSIEFSLRDDIKNSVMQAQPKLGSIFRKKSSRKYIIKISRYLKLNHEKVDIATLPFEVLVGWIGHELGHIVDYKERGVLGMIGFGTRYLLSTRFVLGAERAADLFALQHGMGEHIMETKRYVLNHEEIPTVYKERIKRLYMSPEDFEQLLGEVAP